MESKLTMEYLVKHKIKSDGEEDKGQKFMKAVIDGMFHFIGEDDVNYDFILKSEAYKESPKWFERYTWTKEQQEEFKKSLKKAYMKQYDLDAAMAEGSASMFLMFYGFKFKDENNKNQI